MWLSLALLTTTILGDPKPIPAWRLGLDPGFGHAFHSYRPRVEVWTNKDQVYTRGERVRVFFRTDVDAYVTVMRVDTDGRLRVLFPRDPWEDAFVRGGETYEARGRSDSYSFEVYDYPGVGYVFAVASADPFRYDPIVAGDHWDYRVVSTGRIHGDPYVELTSFAHRILPSDEYADWDYDMAPYYVDRRYDYPRFLCYDCHGYTSWLYWDPYRYSCVRFRMVIYDDPYYYPYRYYGGTRVVFVRPGRPEPRYIFKDRGGASDYPYVMRVAQRPVDGTGRRDPDRGVTGRDIGRIVDTPNRRRPEERPGFERPGDDGRDRPDHPDDRGRRRRPDEPPGRPEDPGDQGRRRRPDEPPGRERQGQGQGQNPQPNVLPPIERREPQRERPQEPELRRREPPREEPRRQEPRREEPRREEPRRQEPRREEPRREEPRRQEPRRQEPRREEPRREEPRREEPRRAEPQRESPAPRQEPQRQPQPSEPRRRTP